MDRRHIPTAALVVALGSALASITVAQDDDAASLPSRYSRRDVLLAAQACVHETTWAGAATGDCGGIVQVVEARRAEHERFEVALARTMPRFYAGTTSRAWTRGLRAGPITTLPGWAAPVPASAYTDEWHEVYVRTANFMLGREALPCAETPRRWFGRATDHEALERTLATGEWREAHCGETRNAFLYSVDVD